jgi:phosphoglycerol transferase MdoB-like AlkP superfamily enzyme
MNDNAAVEQLESSKRLYLFRLFCAVVWAGELFWIQAMAFETVPWIKYPVFVQLFRLGLDFIFATTLLFLLPQRFSILLQALNALVMIVIGDYAINFHWPLMPVRTISEWREGWSLHSQIFELVPLWLMGTIGFLFLVKFFLLLKSGRNTLSLRVRWRLLGVSLLIYSLPVAAVQMTHHMKLSIGPNGGPGRAVYAYGYMLPWLCDLLGNQNLEKQAARAKAYLTHNYDRLAPLEKPLPVPGHIVVLQLESVDISAINASCHGSLVMPFLHELKDQSMFYRILSFHRNGSCDMDYAATTGVEPYPGVVPYRLPGMEYTNSIPAFMSHYGFKTYVFHGNTELFYDRGQTIHKLGFDHIFFKEQLMPKHLPSSAIGFRDADVLNCLLKALQSENRAYLFCITLDSHAPFTQLNPQEMEIFPDPKNPVELYLNSIRYVDNCLRNFISQLPPGTTVLMYGDHTTSMRSSLFNSDFAAGKEYVGCLIYQRGNDLARLQQTREQPIATNGTLNLLDVFNYLRHGVEASSRPAASQ